MPQQDLFKTNKCHKYIDNFCACREMHMKCKSLSSKMYHTMQKKVLLAQKVHHSTNSNTTVVKSNGTTDSLQRKWSKENALGARLQKQLGQLI